MRSIIRACPANGEQRSLLMLGVRPLRKGSGRAGIFRMKADGLQYLSFRTFWWIFAYTLTNH
jgi:hypothetical protein